MSALGEDSAALVRRERELYVPLRKAHEALLTAKYAYERINDEYQEIMKRYEDSIKMSEKERRKCALFRRSRELSTEMEVLANLQELEGLEEKHKAILETLEKEYNECEELTRRLEQEWVDQQKLLLEKRKETLLLQRDTLLARGETSLVEALNLELFEIDDKIAELDEE